MKYKQLFKKAMKCTYVSAMFDISRVAYLPAGRQGEATFKKIEN